MKAWIFLPLVLLVLTCSGCAHLDPGSNALIVRAEQTETIALATFDLVLGIDNASRDFYRTNLPAFHGFCEWLRRPVSTGGTNTLPASLAMVQNLNNVKLAYARSQVSSNILVSVIGVLTSSVEQASQWILTVNKPRAELVPVKPNYELPGTGSANPYQGQYLFYNNPGTRWITNNGILIGISETKL